MESGIRYIASISQDIKAKYLFDKLSDLISATTTEKHAATTITTDTVFKTALITTTTQSYASAYENDDNISKIEVRVFWRLAKFEDKKGKASVDLATLRIGSKEWLPSFEQDTKYDLEAEDDEVVLESLFIFDRDNTPTTTILNEGDNGSRDLQFDFGFSSVEGDLFQLNTSINVYYVEYRIFVNDVASQIRVNYRENSIESGQTISLGSITKNTSSTLNVIIRNVGTTKLNLPSNAISSTLLILQNDPTTSGKYGIDVEQNYSLVFSVPTATVGNFSTQISIASDDPSTPVFRFNVSYTVVDIVATSPTLSVLQNNSAINNGRILTIPAVVVSSSSTVDITIRNSGTADLSISGATISGDGTVSGLSTFGNSITITPSQTKILKIVLDTTNEGNKIVTYTINSNDSAHNPFLFKISYQVSKPHEIKLRNNDSSIKPSEAVISNDSNIDVGLINDSYTKSYTIQNDGISTDLIINSIRTTGSLVVSSTPSFPFTLRASASNSLTFLITFKTDSSGSKLGDIVIDWSAAS